MNHIKDEIAWKDFAAAAVTGILTNPTSDNMTKWGIVDHAAGIADNMLKEMKMRYEPGYHDMAVPIKDTPK